MGSDLARLTVPIGFTGKKGRKLVVKVVEKANPPWGTWKDLSRVEEKRRTFTIIRKKINELIEPNMVEHGLNP
jgi:hypothetical protein